MIFDLFVGAISRTRDLMLKTKGLSNQDKVEMGG